MKEYTVRLNEDTAQKLLTLTELEGLDIEEERLESALERLVNDTYNDKAKFLVGWVDDMDRDGDEIIGCFEASLHPTLSSAINFYENVGRKPLVPVWSSRWDEVCRDARSNYLKAHKIKDVERN